MLLFIHATDGHDQLGTGPEPLNMSRFTDLKLWGGYPDRDYPFPYTSVEPIRALLEEVGACGTPSALAEVSPVGELELRLGNAR